MVRETRRLTTHSFYPNVQVLGVVGPLVFVFVVVTGVADRNWRYYMIVTGDKVRRTAVKGDKRIRRSPYNFVQIIDAAAGLCQKFNSFNSRENI